MSTPATSATGTVPFGAQPGARGTDTGAIAVEIERLHEFSTQAIAKEAGSVQLAVVPSGKSIVDLRPMFDALRERPERRRGTATLRDTDSFVALVERYASDHSAIFANPDKAAPKLTAVFDYYPKSEDASQTDWMQHRASYAPELSNEWRAWTASNERWMLQGDFAAFVDERIRDLVVPALDDPALKTYASLVEGSWASPSDMVRLSRSLQVNVESVVKNAQTLNSGEVSIVFEEIHRDGAGQPLKVPTLFTIAIPVFTGAGLYRIAARLRYRVNGGKIGWSYLLVRPDLVFDDAFSGILEKVKLETGVPVFLGTPEST